MISGVLADPKLAKAKLSVSSVSPDADGTRRCSSEELFEPPLVHEVKMRAEMAQKTTRRETIWIKVTDEADSVSSVRKLGRLF